MCPDPNTEVELDVETPDTFNVEPVGNHVPMLLGSNQCKKFPSRKNFFSITSESVPQQYTLMVFSIKVKKVRKFKITVVSRMNNGFLVTSLKVSIYTLILIKFSISLKNICIKLIGLFFRYNVFQLLEPQYVFQ